MSIRKHGTAAAIVGAVVAIATGVSGAIGPLSPPESAPSVSKYAYLVRDLSTYSYISEPGRTLSVSLFVFRRQGAQAEARAAIPPLSADKNSQLYYSTSVYECLGSDCFGEYATWSRVSNQTLLVGSKNFTYLPFGAVRFRANDGCRIDVTWTPNAAPSLNTTPGGAAGGGAAKYQRATARGTVCSRSIADSNASMAAGLYWGGAVKVPGTPPVQNQSPATPLGVPGRTLAPVIPRPAKLTPATAPQPTAASSPSQDVVSATSEDPSVAANP